MALTKVPSNLDAAVSVTQSQSDNSTNVATTAYVDLAISNLSDSAPAALNTLNEIADALGDNENYAATTTAAIADKLPLGGGTMTGALVINDTADNQILLTSPSSWTGIGFNDSASAGVQYLWHNGTHGTFAFGGGGSSVANKKLHVDGGMTIGSGYDTTAVTANSLKVQGTISSAGGTMTGNLTVTGTITTTNAATTNNIFETTSNNTRSHIIAKSKDSAGNSVQLNATTVGDGPYGMLFTFTNHPLTFATNNLAPQMTLLTNGNFGIGTATPTSIQGFAKVLKVEDASNASIVVSGGVHEAEYAVSSSGGWFGTATNIPQRFISNNTHRMTLDVNGRLGLGEQQHATADQRTIEGRVDIRMNQAGVNWTDGNYSEIWDSAGTPGSKFNDTMLHIDTNRNGGSTGGVVGIAFSPGWQGHQNWGIVATNKTGGSYSQGDLSFVSQLNDGSIHERMRLSGAGNISVGTTTSAKFEINHGRQTGALGLSTATAFKLSQATGAPAVGNIVQMSMGYGNNYSNIAIAAIRTSAAAYGTDDLVFATKSGTTDSAPTERMRINSSGIMTVARTPGFVAIIGSSQTIGAGVSGLSGNFWTTIHHNMGGHFSTTTGKFTAPVTGLYWFNVSLATGSGGAATTYFGAEIYHNTTRITTGWNEHTAGYQKTNASYQLYMTAGQTAHAGIETQVTMTLLGSSSANNRYCVFSGYLIG